ncbi:alcohol dehydrogenase catalytic domain-containing protein [Phytoactinopolyspora halotolerans]|uniref:alcohol dehydrogenase n=1 Tax=Phytoactinopolyspora halotolerans TaxID=1981512 RepID=A0A6L9S7I5_9ACTN|nr:alcohol dehydrogenase catalytic domain-containing protein [Phytoactinopolyspora halotolerans]
MQLWTGGTTVERTAVALPALTTGEALVKVRLATVCGSDLHTVAGRRRSPCPGVLGHEAVGEIVATGPGGVHDVSGRRLRVGDRVVWSVIVSCGSCDRCRSGRSAKCRAVRKIGHEPFGDGGWKLSGCYATHVHLPSGAHLVRVPDVLADAVAAPAACATATVVATVDRSGGLTGRRVLISGAGMLGITATAMAAAEGAAEITVVDVDPGRLELAGAFGASRVIGAGAAERDRRGVPDVAADGEVDVALDFSGAPEAIERAFGALDVEGVLVLAGSVAPGPAVGLDPERTVRRWLTVRGVHNYEPHHLVSAVEMLHRTAEIYPWSDLIGAVRPLSELPDLFSRRTNGTARPPRFALHPDE